MASDKATPANQRQAKIEYPLALILGLTLCAALVLVLLSILLPNYHYLDKAIHQETLNDLRHAHQSLQVTLDYRLDTLSRDLRNFATHPEMEHLLDERRVEKLDQLLDRSRPFDAKVTLDLHFISVRGEIVWADEGREFYQLGDRLTDLAAGTPFRGRWYLLAIQPGTERLVLLVRKEPIIIASGEVAGTLYGAVVLNDNKGLAKALDSAFDNKGLAMAYNGQLLSHTLMADAPALEHLQQRLDTLEEVITLTPQLASFGHALSIEGKPSDLSLFPIYQNQLFRDLERQLLWYGTLGLVIVLLMGLGLTWILHRATLAPLKRLLHYTQSVAREQSILRYPPGSVYEFNQVGRALEAMVARLQERDRSLQDLFDSAFSPIIVWDAQRRVERINPAAVRLVGKDQSLAPGLLAEQLFPPGAEALLRRTCAGEALAGIEFHYPQGQCLCWNFAPVTIEGQVSAVIAQGLEVTALKASERACERAREEAENTARTKQNFIAVLSQKVRAPMNGVLEISRQLLDTELTPVQRNYAQSIQESGNALIELINDTLDFAHIEEGELRLDVKSFELERLLAESAEPLAPLARDQGIELHVTPSPKLSGALVGDPAHIRQVIGNLLSNALNCTDSGEVRLEAQCLEEDDSSALLLFSVTDTGIGISRDRQALLFQPFAHATEYPDAGKSGLGLPTCKLLVEQMGGTMGVESRPAQGSRFWFRLLLPYRRDSDADPGEPPHVEASASQVPPSTPTEHPPAAQDPPSPDTGRSKLLEKEAEEDSVS